MNTAADTHWFSDIFVELERHQVSVVCHVPDAGHAKLIERCDASASLESLLQCLAESGEESYVTEPLHKQITELKETIGDVTLCPLVDPAYLIEQLEKLIAK